MPKTQKQREILTEYYRRLKKTFSSALATMTEPGHNRTWLIPYLADVLAAYLETKNKKVDGKRLSSVISKNPRRAIQKLIAKSSNRDRKTRSRWAAALDNAYKTGVPPEKLESWFRRGGGVSGRAR